MKSVWEIRPDPVPRPHRSHHKKRPLRLQLVSYRHRLIMEHDVPVAAVRQHGDGWWAVYDLAGVRRSPVGYLRPWQAAVQYKKWL